MMSMLLGTEASGINYDPYLAEWSTAINYLNTSVAGTAGTITNGTPPASISISTGVTLIGTTVNISAGTSVEVEITDGTSVSTTVVGIVQLDGTWEAVVTALALSGLSAGAGNITASVMDDTGRLRTDIDAVTLVA
jgi:hypothetical protein